MSHQAAPAAIDQPSEPARRGLAHGLVKMTGRDPLESHRVASPLELLYDLTFVIAFSAAANELAHFIAVEHFKSGLIGFGFAMFAIVWAWINFAWFASAYDTDDWAYRLLTMVQMVGVIILALGIPRLFESLDEGEFVDNGVMVAGYVVIRVALVVQWLRAANQDPARRRICLTYVKAILIAQVGWVILIFIETSIAQTLAAAAVLVLVELTGPVLAESKDGGTPWHPHHIAERYGLLTIIALGEGVIGTVASLGAVIDGGWSFEAALVAVAGVGMTFGLWWIYFDSPSGEILEVHRDRAFTWGYVHMLLYAAIAATGAGLHVAAYYLAGDDGHDTVSVSATVVILSVAIPVGTFIFTGFGLYASLVRGFDAFHAVLLLITALVLVLAVVLAARGVDMAVCLMVVMLAPLACVLGYETLGHQHKAQALAAL